MLKYLLIGWALTILQGILAYRVGWFSQKQMSRQGKLGWSFREHGGMWMDLVFITPTMSYILAYYHQEIVSGLSFDVLGCLLIGAPTMAIVASWTYSKNPGSKIDEAHNHGGLGWIHGIYALLVFWIMIVFYFHSDRSVEFRKDLIWISIVLTPFFFMGAVKLNMKWVRNFLCLRDPGAIVQGVLGPMVIWTITIIRELRPY